MSSSGDAGKYYVYDEKNAIWKDTWRRGKTEKMSTLWQIVELNGGLIHFKKGAKPPAGVTCTRASFRKMVNAEETKRFKAKQLRYKKPIVRELNLEAIQQELWDIQEECENVRWYTDSEDGEDSLINSLDGDEEEAYEFKMAFADLCAECERMFEDLQEEWVPDCFDRFFVAVGAGENYGGLLGHDSYEQDYFGLSCEEAWAEDESKKVLKRMTKDELIAASRQCFRVYQAYLGLRNRYDNLKSAIDILRDQNTGHLQVVKEIEKLYEAASKSEWSRNEWSKESREWKRYTDALPQEAWLM